MATRAVNNPGNFTIGPSTIWVGEYGDTKDMAREVGITQGGVSYNHTQEMREFDDADQYIGVVGAEKIGDRMEITIRLKEPILENLALAWGLPDGNLDEAENKLTFGGDYDIPYRSLFIDGPAPGGGTAEWQIWRVLAYTSSEVADTKEDNTLLEVTFLVIEDLTKAEHQRYGQRIDTYDDTTAPTITGVVPEDAGDDVAVDTTITWTFDENIQQRDINSGNFNVVDDTGAEVAGELSYNQQTFEVVFTPDTELSNATTYLTFASGEIRDMAGNAMGSNHRTTFTTIA